MYLPISMHFRPLTFTYFYMNKLKWSEIKWTEHIHTHIFKMLGRDILHNVLIIIFTRWVHRRELTQWIISSFMPSFIITGIVISSIGVSLSLKNQIILIYAIGTYSSHNSVRNSRARIPLCFSKLFWLLLKIKFG